MCMIIEGDQKFDWREIDRRFLCLFFFSFSIKCLHDSMPIFRRLRSNTGHVYNVYRTNFDCFERQSKNVLFQFSPFFSLRLIIVIIKRRMIVGWAGLWNDEMRKILIIITEWWERERDFFLYHPQIQRSKDGTMEKVYLKIIVLHTIKDFITFYLKASKRCTV